MKRILLSILVFLAAVSMHAELAVKIYTKSGDCITIAFKDKPVLTYQNGCIVIKSEDAQKTVTIPISQLANSKVEGESYATDIEAISYGTLNEDVKVYTLDGMLVKTLPAGTEGVMPFSDLQHGIYVIKKGKITHKVQIK